MMNSPYSLEGKLVLVTGASTGIGNGIGLEAARQGADVVLSYSHSVKGAEDAVRAIQAMGRRAAAIRRQQRQPHSTKTARVFKPGWSGLCPAHC